MAEKLFRFCVFDLKNQKFRVTTIILSLVSLFLSFSSCSDGDTTKSEIVIVGSVNKVLILGNSITRHAPAPDLGWNGYWGMAASCESNDFVHLLINKFKVYNSNIEVKYNTIGSLFETRFWNFDTLDFKEYKDFNADLIIIRLGENINDSFADKYDLRTYLTKLIYYLRRNKHTIVCCTDSFWPNEYIDKYIEEVCAKNNFYFVSISDLYNDNSNTAKGQFDNYAVSIHPSDKGMQNIADRIWGKIKIFFE